MKKISTIAYSIFLLFSCSLLVCGQEMDGQNKQPEQKADNMIKYPFREATQRSSTGSFTVIKGDTLNYPTSNLMEALSGKIPSGLFSTSTYGPGGINVNSSIRGLGVNTLVDGMSTSMTALDPMEIESVSVIKGITDRALMGSEAKFNLIMVNTKRGKAGENDFKASVETGTKMTQFLPEWVSGYENALIYNQACVNDGVTPKYDNNFLNGLQSGSNNLRYPNENYYGSLFNNNASYRRVGISYSGGSTNTQYFIYMGYLNEGNGLMKIQERNLNRFSLRGNLDTKITESIKLSLDFVGRFNYLNIPVNESSIFSVTSTYPSFAFPIVAKDDPQDFRYGRTVDFATNPIAQQTLMGGTVNKSQYAQSKIQLNFDMSSLIKGLSFTTGLNYGINTNVSYAKKSGLTFKLLEPVYLQSSTGADSLAYISYGQDNKALASVQTGNDLNQNFVTFGKLGYINTFGRNKIDLALVDYYRYYFPQDKGNSVAKNDLTFAARYAFDEKYYAEAGLTYSRDNFLPTVNRGKFFPSFGAGWIISEESFLKNSSWVNYLKLRANYGIIGSSDVTNYYLSVSQWIVPGSISLGPASGPRSYQAVSLSQTGNPDIDWVLNKQFDAGIDFSGFDNKIALELNAYNYVIDGILDTELAPKVVGNFVKMVNIGKNRYYGTELYAEYRGKVRSFQYAFGVNAGYKKSEILADNNPVYSHPWMNQIGNPTDGIYGYVAKGLFSSQPDIDNSPQQFIGNVRTGDVKYADLDGNNKVETNLDQKMIGHSSPSFIYGVNVSLSYRNFGLTVLGTGVSDVDLNVVQNTYFHPEQKDKYSVYAAERLKKGDFPAPTTGLSNNNSTVSSYWLIDGSYFKIKNVELSYTLPQNVIRILKSENLRLFVRGTNLLTFTKVPDLDPEALSAGISNYPSMKTLTGGFNITF